MEDKTHIIVVGRQFGSGGRLIGQALAGHLGIPYYDKQLMSEAARRLGFDEEIFRRTDERPKWFHSIPGLDCGSADLYNSSVMSREGLYRAQSEAITQIAAEGSCVIVGRTADYVLRDHPGMVSIFLHAPEEWRARRIVERGDCDNEADAVHLARKRDSQRERYYNFFTGRHWGRCDNYHLSLDPSRLGTQGAVDLIVAYLAMK